MDFVHLHVHSHYSLLDGASRVDALVGAAAKFGMKALAVTDHGNLYGAMEFYNAARKAGIKPILGIEAYISPTTRQDRSMGNIETAAYHLLLLAMSEKGWRNLLKLSSLAFIEGFYYRPRVDREILAKYGEDIVCCTACLGGEVPSALLKGDEDKARKIAGEYLDIFGKDRFFIEMQNQGYPEQEIVNPGLVKIAKSIGARLVGTNDVHFLRAEDKSTHEILTCIATGKVLSSEEKLRYSPQLFFKDQAGMHEALSAWPGAADNTNLIAEMCDCKLDYSKRHLPAFHTPDGSSAEQFLDREARAGLKARFAGGTVPPEYQKRLDWELKVITDKGYSSYFLIVNDCVQFARRNSIPAAPRGSGVATLLGYSLGMADVDPLRYGLLFERFTDPQREEHPDIDLDICQEGRASVIQYVREKYGHVAQIVTYGTLKARAAIRDVGRVMDMPLADVDRIAKMVPEGPKSTLKSAMAQEPDLRNLYESDPRIKEMIDHSSKIEGLVRHSGVHAAGVVICDHPLDDILPLCKQADSDDAITQWDGPTCEKAGLMKMDFLGLRTLTIIQRARTLVKERTGVDMDPEKLPLDDQKVYELFRKGETDGVFQFESDGMKGVLTQMQPNRIEDLIAANAMYRPGPMQLIPTYCARKSGKEKVPSIHPRVDPVLAETYGIMVYQEQVMQMLFLLGNIPLNRALSVIKAVSKKKEDVLLKEKPAFIEGAGANGIAKEKAQQTYDLILEFAGYGFNKAHSTRYAIVAYQTAYFKVHYPREFLAATLTYESADRDKVVQYMAEAARMGVRIAAPDINTCSRDFTVDGEQVRFGLAAVKGVGAKAVEAIAEARNAAGGRFKDIHHFCRSVDLRAVNRATIEALIKCGAFDSMQGTHRAALLAGLDRAMAAAQSHASDRNRGQISLFGSIEADTVTMSGIADVEEWTCEQKLTAEKETLGFYVTAHPLDQHVRLFRQINWPRGFTLSGAGKLGDNAVVVCGCLIAQIRSLTAKRGKSAGKKMASLMLEDLTGRCEAMVFPETFERIGRSLEVDTVQFVTGKVSIWNERFSISVDDVCPVHVGLERFTGGLVVRLPANGVADGMLNRLRELFERHAGNCQVVLHVQPSDAPNSFVEIGTGRRWCVKPSQALLDEIGSVVGAGNIGLRPKQPASKAVDSRQRWKRPAGME